MQILSDVDDLTTRVDDSVVTMGNVLASPHVGPIRSEAEEFARKLNLLQVKSGEPFGCIQRLRARTPKLKSGRVRIVKGKYIAIML